MDTLCARLPRNELFRFPSGRWGFVGRVDARLSYVRLDGSEPTEEELRAAARYGPRAAHLTTRTWATREEAASARAALD